MRGCDEVSRTAESIGPALTCRAVTCLHPRARMAGVGKSVLTMQPFLAFRELHLQPKGSDAVFVSRNHGEPVHGPRHWFENAAREAGLKDFTWHDQRRTFASWLVTVGTDLRTVDDLLKHANIQMTMRHAHLAPDHKQQAVDRLCAFGKAPKSGIVGRSKKRPRSEGKREWQSDSTGK